MPSVTIRISDDKLAIIDAHAHALGISRTEYLIAVGCAPEAARALRMVRQVTIAREHAAQLIAELEHIIRTAEE